MVAHHHSPDMHPFEGGAPGTGSSSISNLADEERVLALEYEDLVDEPERSLRWVNDIAGVAPPDADDPVLRVARSR